jgi:hypothetical protein
MEKIRFFPSKKMFYHVGIKIALRKIAQLFDNKKSREKTAVIALDGCRRTTAWPNRKK